MSRRRTAHFVSSWVADEVKTTETSDFGGRSSFCACSGQRCAAVGADGARESSSPRLCLNVQLAVNDQKQLLVFTAGSEPWWMRNSGSRSVFPPETCSVPFPPSRFVFSRENSKSSCSGSTADTSFSLRFSPPSHKCFSTGTSCTNKWKVQ